MNISYTAVITFVLTSLLLTFGISFAVQQMMYTYRKSDEWLRAGRTASIVILGMFLLSYLTVDGYYDLFVLAGLASTIPITRRFTYIEPAKRFYNNEFIKVERYSNEEIRSAMELKLGVQVSETGTKIEVHNGDTKFVIPYESTNHLKECITDSTYEKFCYNCSTRFSDGDNGGPYIQGVNFSYSLYETLGTIEENHISQRCLCNSCMTEIFETLEEDHGEDPPYSYAVVQGI